MRTFFIILVVLLVLGFFTYRWGKTAADKLTFNIGFKGVYLRGILKNGGFANVNLTANIGNQNNFKIPVSGLYAEVYYNGKILAKSTNSGEAFIIEPLSSTSVNHSITVATGTDTIELLSKIVSGQQVVFDYKIKAILWGIIPFSYKGSFTY